MRNYLLVLALITSCTVLNRPAPKKADTPVVVPPVVVVTTPAPSQTVVGTKFHVTTDINFAPPKEYVSYADRAVKFYQLMLTDKSILDGRKFTYTTDTADQIRANLLKGFDIELKLYWPSRWKFGKSNVIAYHDDWVLYFNALKVGQRTDSPCEVVNTIVHEGLHGLSYQHGDSYPTAVDYQSVPYWSGEKAEEFCLAGKI